MESEHLQRGDTFKALLFALEIKKKKKLLLLLALLTELAWIKNKGSNELSFHRLGAILLPARSWLQKKKKKTPRRYTVHLPEAFL